MGTELQMVALDRVTRHPDHPRVGPREDLVAQIAADLRAEFPRDKAVLVRPRGGGYELLDGVARVDAAVRAGLTEIFAWVKPLGDWDARIEMVIANVRDELYPLEIGLHALRCVPRAEGGRGKTGGLSAYARAIGKKQQQVSVWRQGAEVAHAAVPPSQLVGFRGHAEHLAALHKAHPDVWTVLAKLVIEKNWSVKDTEGAVAKVAALFGKNFDPAGNPWWDLFLPIHDVVTRLATDEWFTATKVRELIGVADETSAILTRAAAPGAPDPRRAEWEADLKAGAGCASWNPRSLRQKLDVLRNTLGGATSLSGGAPEIGWHLGDWRNHLDKLADGSVAAVVTDPPFGMNYRSPARRHRPIAGDESLEGARDLLAAFLGVILPKLRPRAHLFVFCRWDSEPLFDRALTAAGLQVRSHAVWVKNNHGAGDLRGLAPMHERILHATLGDPDLYVRAPDVFEYAKVGTDRHPTEKPQAMFEWLIEISTAKDDLIVDPFGGVATTAAAAKATGRACWSCELDEDYFAAGERRLFGG